MSRQPRKVYPAFLDQAEVNAFLKRLNALQSKINSMKIRIP